MRSRLMWVTAAAVVMTGLAAPAYALSPAPAVSGSASSPAGPFASVTASATPIPSASVSPSPSPSASVTPLAGEDNLCNGTAGVECASAWNGGPYVKTYPYGGGSDNEWYIVQEGDGPCGGYDTTANCPWAGTPAGIPIVNIEGSGGFIGNYGNTSGQAKSGIVGYEGWGWEWLEYRDPQCPASAPFVLFNLHWSGSWGGAAGFGILGTQTGVQLYNNTEAVSCLAYI
jgi:hypothetical protein